jgi:hypothetical protein
MLKLYNFTQNLSLLRYVSINLDHLQILLNTIKAYI